MYDKRILILLFFLIIVFLNSNLKAQEFNCLDCHDNVIKNSAHDGALECADCHDDVVDEDHADKGAEPVNCADCHDEKAALVKTDIHHRIGVDKNVAPDCKECHGTHQILNVKNIASKEKYFCSKCHDGNVVLANPYHSTAVKNQTCFDCHDEEEYSQSLKNSVHKDLQCSNCHNSISNNLSEHPDNLESTQTADCYLCHNDVAKEHRESIHGISLAAGIDEAANCWNCHGSHNIKSINDPASKVSPKNLPLTCGACHDNISLIEKFDIPVSCPSKQYTKSVHGKLVSEGKYAATCSSCHGTHNIKTSTQLGSTISPLNIPETCGQCHSDITEEYKQSIHWIRVKKGRRFAPVCTDCHCEHGIEAPTSKEYSRAEMRKIQEKSCVACHQSELIFSSPDASGLQSKNYQDTYHGLAVLGGDPKAAMCVDCHGVHKILPARYPESTINENNVTQTCRKCHKNATETFSKSYSHTKQNETFLTIQSWVKSIYIWLIIVVIGGMILHNVIIYINEIKEKREKEKYEISVPRFTKNEVIQHIILLTSFILLALTGFALKFPDSWYAEILRAIGLTEWLRGTLHRISAVAMVALSFYHLFYLLTTERGRYVLKNLFPTLEDFKGVTNNLAYYLKLSKEKPEFGVYDYAEKAEYWALIWGTVVMGTTGLFLWFPTLVRDWAPTWLLKVSEMVHFYEAVLATLAIVVWHWFFVIFRPKEYPMSFAWIDGKMPLHHYKEYHKEHFKHIVLEWIKWQNGLLKEDEISNYTKLFDKTLRENGQDPEIVLMDDLNNDTELRQWINGQTDILKQ